MVLAFLLFLSQTRISPFTHTCTILTFVPETTYRRQGVKNTMATKNYNNNNLLSLDVINIWLHFQPIYSMFGRKP